jgi:general stress protein YciG
MCKSLAIRTSPFGAMFRPMAKKSALSKHLSRLGKKGGKARMDGLSPEERRELAREAGKKSGQARRKKAKP